MQTWWRMKLEYTTQTNHGKPRLEKSCLIHVYNRVCSFFFWPQDVPWPMYTWFRLAIVPLVCWICFSSRWTWAWEATRRMTCECISVQTSSRPMPAGRWLMMCRNGPPPIPGSQESASHSLKPTCFLVWARWYVVIWCYMCWKLLGGPPGGAENCGLYMPILGMSAYAGVKHTPFTVIRFANKQNRWSSDSWQYRYWNGGFLKWGYPPNYLFKWDVSWKPSILGVKLPLF